MTNDPLEAADTAALAPREYYGEVLVDTWFCALVKGVGKVPFDPAQHKSRFTAIKIDIVPLSDSGMTNPIGREMIAESNEWIKFTLASIKALNLKTADIRNKWAKVGFAPTGETYENKAGETKEKTALKFLAVYPDEAACRKAYETEHGVTSPVPPSPAQQNGNGHPQADAETRKKLFPFVKLIVTKANEAHPGNVTEINDEVSIKIAESNVLKNYYTGSDPDVIELITNTFMGV